ncbi:DUF2946 domain-containing protein [Candidatus Symbiopectobacterium sp. NZEC151]|uniref:DUF2946 domain-containing protein n=1 Tax=Candidatus Symbiopectobacterium sp. NZEC151 TaxID=2820470 RepID=UPI002226E002|nr:DUF2946 domain-containing protein [Candidatus Symbiopectobacterium sp. NZEC151]MCW2476758.1 DUF2946 domain-containing protein [Candidatus Symbiopectobacterium sp. NZEC151]
MIVSHATTQKSAACLALLAVLLLFVAPVISKGRAERMPLPQTHEMAMNHHSTAPAAHDHAAMMQQQGFACGYCELLVHVPFVVGLFIPMVWLTVLLARAPPLPRVLPPRCPPLDTTHLPRAPPRLHLSLTA